MVVLPELVIPQLQPVFLMNRRTFNREASSRIYSPYVFAIGQLLGEIPYSVLCALIYWVLMVGLLTTNHWARLSVFFTGLSNTLRSRISWHKWHRLPVPCHLDHGTVCRVTRSTDRVDYAKHPDRFPLHTAHLDHSEQHVWGDNPLPYAQQVLESLAISVESFHPNGGGNSGNRASVCPRLVLSCYLCAKWFRQWVEDHVQV